MGRWLSSFVRAVLRGTKNKSFGFSVNSKPQNIREVGEKRPTDQGDTSAVSIVSIP